jgi:hypothetical protein
MWNTSPWACIKSQCLSRPCNCRWGRAGRREKIKRIYRLAMPLAPGEKEEEEENEEDYYMAVPRSSL